MNVSTLNRKFLLSFLLISILTASIGSILNKSNGKTMGVKAMEVGEFIDCKGIEVINKENAHDNLTDNDYGVFEDSEILLGSGGTGSTATLISGTNDYADPFPTATITDLTNVKYIQNSNYFLMNPKHHVNDGSDNSAGTCTTVAMQMLIGYHNYYSDRRIIPNSGNGRIFLNEDYGNLDFHPAFLRSSAEGQGCLKIGTEDGVYSDVFDRTWFSGVPGIGQAITLVKDGAVRFINAYTPQAARNGLSLTSGFFSASQAKADIDAGRPIVLGMSQLFKGNFHVVPAFGYAKLDGIDGFLVHYGWGDGATQVWVPSSWFGFKIRMSTTHAHTYSAGGNRSSTHKDLTCSVCGGTSVDELFSILDGTLSGVRYDLSGSIAIPSVINIYNPLTASFINQSITTIGASAFTEQTQLTQITIPSTVTTIGSDAFKNTNNARIDLAGRTSSPSTFDPNWNPSNNPVYLNGVECLHTSKTLTYISGGKHGLMCDQCRTTTNVTQHPAINLWRDYYQHHSKCSCGLNQIMAHVVSSSDQGYPYKTCLYCGGPAKDAIGQYDKGGSIISVVPSLFIKEYFGNGSYVLQNGIYVISDEDLDSFYDGTLVLPEGCDDCLEHFELHDCVDCTYN